MTENFDLSKDVPRINNTKELSLWLKPVYVINSYMESYESYSTFIAKIMNLLKASYDIKNCREYPVKFQFSPKGKIHTLQLRHFAINAILWYPFVELNDLDVLNEDFIFDCENNIPNIEDYINYHIIVVLRDYNVKSTIINYDISEVLYNLRNISIDFSQIMGLNFSIPTFVNMYEKYPEIKEIMEVRFEETMQPHEIEQKLSELQNREISIYENDPGNPIGVILKSGTGIKTKQFAEFTISEGLKPSLEGVTIPKPIENSTLLRGLSCPSYLYIDATGARKSLVMNKKVINYSCDPIQRWVC